MNRVTRMFREPCALLAVLGLAGCNQLVKIEDSATGGGSGMPPEVRAAFEGSCGKVGCHVAGGTAPTLAGGSLDALVGTKYVTIGDIPASYIAVKMLPDATLEALGILKDRSGARMPLDQDYLNPNNQIILAWIAGAEFADTDGGTGTDTGTTDATGTTGDPTAPTFANVQAIFAASCSCHASDAGLGGLSLSMANAYANIVGKKSVGLPTMNLITANDPSNSYLYLKITNTHVAAKGVGDPMPAAMPLPDDKIMLIEEWINAGALND